jgi:hypothetical protein
VRIPARIIQTGKDRSLAPLAKAATTSLKLLHPDWEYLYFDDEEIRHFVATEYPQYLSIFNAFPQTIQRIDFFRYLVVFRLGGFYFDLDVFLSESLAPLLAHNCVFPFEELTINRYLRCHYGMDWELGNYGFGAKAGDPFLGAVIANCIRAQKDSGWVGPMMNGVNFLLRSEYEVLNTTGPGLLSRTYAECRDLAKGVTVLFPVDVRDPAGWHLFGEYGIHRMDGSWRKGTGSVRRRLAWRWEEVVKARLISESQKLGPSRRSPGPVEPSSEPLLLGRRHAEHP